MNHDTDQKPGLALVLLVMASLGLIGLLVVGTTAFFFVSRNAAQREMAKEADMQAALQAEMAKIDAKAMRTELAIEPLEEKPPGASTARTMTIKIDKEGNILVDGDSIPIDELKDKLSGTANESGSPTAAVIEADNQCPFRHVAAVMSICQAAGIEDMRVTSAGEASDAADVSQQPVDDEHAWQSLFDSKTLQNWKATEFGGEGEVRVEDGAIVMDMGSNMTGITYTGEVPRNNYEFALEGKRIEGIDFFCTTTFPVGDEPCTLVVGGWAGTVVGLSNIDERDASDNETTQYIGLKDKQWYRVRIRVSDTRIQCWIDDKQVVNLPRAGHKFGIRPEVELSRPLGVSTWQTVGAVRNLRLRRLTPEEIRAAAEVPRD